MTYQSTKNLKFKICKFINIHFTFKTSPRTLIFVKNWWSLAMEEAEDQVKEESLVDN